VDRFADEVRASNVLRNRTVFGRAEARIFIG
jgi:hypothetical protein